VVSVVVAGCVVVCSVVVVLVCAKAIGATSAQTRATITFFTLIPPLLWLLLYPKVRDSGVEWTASQGIYPFVQGLDCVRNAAIQTDLKNGVICVIERAPGFVNVKCR
jgi:hypothetical protein